MKRLVNFVPSILSNKNTLEMSEAEDPNNYYSVSVRFLAECACEGIQKFETRLYLSAKPPAFLETKQRFLRHQAPQLPFSKCTLERSRCRYVPYRDRRERDRRYRYDDPQEEFDPGYVGLERRVRHDRRRTQAIALPEDRSNKPKRADD